MDCPRQGAHQTPYGFESVKKIQGGLVLLCNPSVGCHLDAELALEPLRGAICLFQGHRLCDFFFRRLGQNRPEMLPGCGQALGKARAVRRPSRAASTADPNPMPPVSAGQVSCLLVSSDQPSPAWRPISSCAACRTALSSCWAIGKLMLGSSVLTSYVSAFAATRQSRNHAACQLAFGRPSCQYREHSLAKSFALSMRPLAGAAAVANGPSKVSNSPP